MQDEQGFILSRQWRDSRQGLQLDFWLATANGAVQLVFEQQQVVFFLPVAASVKAGELLQSINGWQRKPVALRDFSQQPVDAYYFAAQRTLRAARELLQAGGLSPLEADINPCDRFLMERFIRGSLCFREPVAHSGRGGETASTTAAKTAGGNRKIHAPGVKSSSYQPQFKVLSLDIETAMTELSLYSIGVYACADGVEFSRVFIVAADSVSADGSSPNDGGLSDNAYCYQDEKQLLIAFLDWLAQYDPDVIIGWNIVNFDMWYLQRCCEKHRLPFRLGRGRANARWRVVDEERERRAITVPGRVVLDGIELLKMAAYRFESFSLNNVANTLLGDGKLLTGSDRGEKISELFVHHKQQLVDYNIQDCKLVSAIFEKTGLLEFAIARSQLTGLALDRVGGSVAAFDFRYLPLLHRRNYVAPNGHLDLEVEHSPGGFVMNSKPGIFDHVLVLDFKSLYPSIIRSFKIDPLAMAIGLGEELDQSELVPGFKGAWFAKNNSLLPDIIADLWKSRDSAKSSNDSALSQAIKILMNSFYGVMGAGGCRFFDSRLASSITRRGHQIIQQTAAFIEKDSDLAGSCEVIYGDTDSVFVWLNDVDGDGQALVQGRQLALQLNRWWTRRLRDEYDLDSFLEIEFETHYQRFLMPTVRGSDQGSKKRYAGVVLKEGQQQLVFKGLENVRTDWTKLARDFQLELYRRIFFHQPYRDYIKETVAQVLAGRCDEQLVYRKRLRRKLADYQRNSPPHVQAARKAEAAGERIRSGDWIAYVMTVSGAEPLTAVHSLLDYQHYIDRQLAPVADSILYFVEDSLAAITDQQLGLFG